jgi:hypothetical protein
VSSAAGRIRVPALVIGTGIAGLTAALALAKRGVRVLLLTKADDPGDCNTAWAQGGIIYFGRKDSPASLVKDILAAGAGLCNAEAVRFLAQEGPRVVEEILIGDAGVPFSRTRDGDLDFTREGAHSVARIVHSADATGKAIEVALLARVKAEKNVKIWTGATAIDLITARHHSTDVQQRYALQDPCLGAYVLDASGSVHTVLADFTVLATGGVGRLFLHTTNTRHAIGDGLTMAARAGAAVLNLEYVQFHPTTLYHPDGDRFLISEALRGEGAVLVNRSGKAFMQRYDKERKDLAPRDVVTRAIVEEMTTRGEPCVYLDLAHNYEGRERSDPRPLPDHRGDLREVRDRHRDRADPGRPRRALLLRRRPGRPRGKDDDPQPLRRRRDELHRPPRGEPPRVDVAPGRARLGGPRRPFDRRPDREGTHVRPVDVPGHPRLEGPGRRPQRGPRPHPAGLDDDPQHDVELRRHRPDLRTTRPRRGRHPRPREAPLALLPRDEDLARDRRPDPRSPREPPHRAGRPEEPRLARLPLVEPDRSGGPPVPPLVASRPRGHRSTDRAASV